VSARQALEALRGVPMFRGLIDRDVELLERHASVMRCVAGTDVVRAGEPGEEFFVILAGSATVHLDERVFDDIGPGDHFGELALLDPAPRDATVTATTDLTVLVLGRRGFLSAVRQVPSIAETVLAHLAHRLRDADRARTDG
jgi:CRP-like cAMP-binding protein